MPKETHAVGFNQKKSTFPKEQRLGRIVTVSLNMQPHVVPVAFEFDGRSLYFGGWKIKNSLNFRNRIQNNKMAFVADDLV
jgi:pyridoxamine 5'-phosphate oxidase family protein